MDVSSYPQGGRYVYRVSSSQMPVDGDLFTIVQPALIRFNEGEYHAAQLIVTIWN